MIDIHSHVIFGVDDGPSTIQQSLNMINQAEKLGIHTIIATPHFDEKVYRIDDVEENYKELLYKTRDFNVTLNLGYEVLLNPNNPTLPKNLDRLCMSDFGILLFEFPFNSPPQKCIEMVRKLRLQNIIPVLAHIERNRSFLNGFEYIIALIKTGCCIQIDAASIAGVYGRCVKEFSKKLIKMKCADIVASNAHCAEDYKYWYPAAYDNVLDWAGEEDANRLFYQNSKNILKTDQSMPGLEQLI